MSASDLWAKSGITPPILVAEHGRDVADSGLAIFDAVSDQLAAALGAAGEEICVGLRPLLEAAGILHDFAKINSAFQAMLRAERGLAEPQAVRHEILGALLFAEENSLGSWFRQLRSSYECWPIIWAIAGHHLKMSDPAQGNALFSSAGAAKWLCVPLSDPQARGMLESAALVLGSSTSIPELMDLRFDVTDDDDNSLEQRVSSFVEKSIQTWEQLRKEDKGIVLRTALLKALLISSDVAGSALTAKGLTVGTSITDALRIRLGPETLGPVITKGTKNKSPLDFQTAVGDAPTAATIVIAGCGNGKTTAAYMWARRWAVDRKLIFTYPTTGTASAGFEDYVFRQPELAAALIHGRAIVDLQAMQKTGEEDAVEETLRIESLQAWDRQAIVCTVDTVLGLMQNNRRPMFSFPAIAAGAIVFDEIHSYDAHLFGALIRFLETFPGMPVLLMSASIPPTRLTQLRHALGSRLGPIVHGDSRLESYKRYRLRPRGSKEECQTDVKAALSEGNKNKILWVCNTVGDAVGMASNARRWIGANPIIYHSRFRYGDRVKRQNELIRRLRSADPVLAITTQVCEMSLDVSANLLVTAECPLPSLVQRLGRLNRYAEFDDPWPCLVYPFTGLPYNEDPEKTQMHGDFRIEMKATRDAMVTLANAPCSQRDLANLMDQMVTDERPHTYSAWLDDGWLSEPAQLRDGDQSITLIRAEDLGEIKGQLGSDEKNWTSRRLVPWTIPMTYRREFRFERRIGGYPLAPTGTVAYCDEEGASWPNSKNP